MDEVAPPSPTDADEAYLLRLDCGFRDRVEAKVDAVLRRTDAANPETLEKFALTAAEEARRAKLRKDRTGSAIGRAMAAVFRFRAKRLLAREAKDPIT